MSTETIEKPAPVKVDDKTFKKVVKEGSNWSSIRVVGTALTAITMALVASKLTNFVSSLALVGMLSVGTALFSEVYRILLSFTTLSAKKVVAPVFKVEKKNAVTGELEIVDVSTETVAVVSEPSIAEIAAYKELPSWQRAFKYLWRNSVIRLVLLFAVVATLTVTVSYFVSNAAEKVETTYTTVNNPAQMLTDAEKQEIIDNASIESEQSVWALQMKVEELKDEKSTLETKVSNLESEAVLHKDNMLSVQEQIDALKKQVDEKEVPVVIVPTPAPEPTVPASPTVSPDDVTLPESPAKVDETVPTVDSGQ